MLVAIALANLHPNHAATRDTIISTLDVRLDGRSAAGVSCAQLITMLQQHQSCALPPPATPPRPPPPLYDARPFATLRDNAVQDAAHTQAATPHAPSKHAPVCQNCLRNRKGRNQHFHKDCPHRRIGFGGGRGSAVDSSHAGKAVHAAPGPMTLRLLPRLPLQTTTPCPPYMLPFWTSLASPMILTLAQLSY
jgi:hypothetical protein